MSRYKQPFTLYKRGKYWYYRTYTPDGLRTSGKTTGQTSKNAAKEYCNNLYLSGDLFKSEILFSKYAGHFFDDDSSYVKDRLEPLADNTLRGYRTRMKINIMPYFQNIKIGDITYSHLKNFRAQMIEEDYSPSVVVSTMNTLKHIIDRAFRDRLIPVNPFIYLEPMDGKKRARDAFRLEEIKILYNALPEFQKTVLLMALTGTRISEAVGLRFSDVKTTAEGVEWIDLKEQFEHKKYKKLKTKDVRPIPIIPEIKELFGFDHTRLSAFYREFQPVKEKFERAEERNLSFHSLRHFFITNSKAEGINPVKVEFMAGHKLNKNSNQEATYTHFTADDMTEILEWQRETWKKITE